MIKTFIQTIIQTISKRKIGIINEITMPYDKKIRKTTLLLAGAKGSSGFEVCSYWLERKR